MIQVLEFFEMIFFFLNLAERAGSCSTVPAASDFVPLIFPPPVLSLVVVSHKLSYKITNKSRMVTYHNSSLYHKSFQEMQLTFSLTDSVRQWDRK